ncbi:MAG TPA: nucleotide exchange factor GrpE [Clostridiaceae bacterium]|jgi:molecular chaperone GrpE|nr:nucleotide exchange factor GrpE [Clostridiaceae bacterium]
MAKKKKSKLESEDLNQKQTDSPEEVKDSEEMSETAETDDNDTDVTAETEIKAEESNLKDEYAELNDRFLRLVAEYDNFRKRSQKEKDFLYSDSVFDVCKAWLPVLDNLDRAIDASEKFVSEESKQMAEGMEMVRRQALEVMSGLGVEMMDCLGERFDPEYHEAVAHVEDDSYGEGEIIDVLQKGYIKGDRVIRYAVVRVAN